MSALLGNGRHALADAMDIVTAELEMLIDRHFGARRELIVEPEGPNWTASIGDNVLFRSPDGRAVLRFARTFAERTPGVQVMVPSTFEAFVEVREHSVRVDADVVPIRGGAA